jgi:hypothetical protein
VAPAEAEALLDESQRLKIYCRMPVVKREVVEGEVPAHVRYFHSPVEEEVVVLGP